MNQQKIMIKQKTIFHDFEKIIIFLNLARFGHPSTIRNSD